MNRHMNHYLRSHTCDKVITVMSNALTPEQGNVLMQRNADFSNLMYSPGKHTHTHTYLWRWTAEKHRLMLGELLRKRTMSPPAHYRRSWEVFMCL